MTLSLARFDFGGILATIVAVGDSGETQTTGVCPVTKVLFHVVVLLVPGPQTWRLPTTAGHTARAWVTKYVTLVALADDKDTLFVSVVAFVITDSKMTVVLLCNVFTPW